jgi:thymidylate synthase
MIKVPTIEDAWMSLLKNIVETGDRVKIDGKVMTTESMNQVVKIFNPLSSTPPENQIWGGEKLEIYKKQFQSPENPGFVYTYGNRLRDYFGVDQVEKVIKRLKEDKSSRRCVMTTFDPHTDHDIKDLPCMIMVDFKIRKTSTHPIYPYELLTTAVWRSHDIYGAYLPNIFGLTGLAQKVAEELNVAVGAITTHSISAHIYDTDLDDAKKIVTI